MSTRRDPARIRPLLIAMASCVLAGCSGEPGDSARSPATVEPPVVIAAGIAPPPSVPMVDFAESLHGIPVPDPLRSLEDVSSPATREFVAAQQAYADSVVDRLVGLESLQARVERAYQDAPTLGAVTSTAGGLLLTRWLGPAPSLFALDIGSTTERMVLDADSLARQLNGARIRVVMPNGDGTRIAIGTTEQGDSHAGIAVLDAATGALLPDRVPDLLTTTSGTRYLVSWLPDGSGFFYPRLWPESATGPSADRLARGRQFLHVLGTPQAADVPVFGFDVSPSITVDKADLPTRVYTAPGSAWLVATLYRSRESATDFYFAPGALAPHTPRTPAPAWRPLASPADSLSQPQLRGNTVYALSRATADRGAIVRRELRADGAGEWVTVVPEQRGVIIAFTVQKDALYFTERDAGAVALRRLPHGPSADGSWAIGSASIDTVPLESPGTVRLQAGAPEESGVMFSTESWATPPRWQRVVDGGGVAALPIDDGRASSSDGEVTAARLEAPSSDGTLVPVSIVYGAKALRNGVLDGTAPLFIDAYGGFGVSTDPAYNPIMALWTSLGGVYAFAHVRGGGELGEAWHTAAMREHKQRSIDDMIGAIEALIARRYTSAGRVTLMGVSFGADIAGLVMVQRPDLLGAVLFEVGQPDEIRGAMLDPTAARNISEIGDLDTPEGVKMLMAASPYHRIPKTVALPAVIVHSADDDYNFGTQMLSGKYVARLQAANSGNRPVVWLHTAGGHRELLSVSPEWAAKALSFALWQCGDHAYQPPPK